MRVIRGWDSVPAELKGAVLAVGNFDGVHRGHQAVLSEAIAHARALGAPAGVMVFDPHPREFFAPDRPLFKLTPIGYRLRLLGALGLDLAVVLAFDARLAAMPAEQFIAEVLVAGLGVRQVVVGYDFNFGKGRTGTPELLRREGDRCGFEVAVVPAFGGEGSTGQAISSSGIRDMLRRGEVRAAAMALGHWWRVSGTVISGAGRGNGMGYPTANITLPVGTELKHGIYAARVHVEGKRFAGAAYLGTRPTFDDGAPLLETFLFDFDGNLYGREIEIELIEFLRGDQAFAGMEALKAQMDSDCRTARQVLEAIARDDPLAGSPLANL